MLQNKTEGTPVTQHSANCDNLQNQLFFFSYISMSETFQNKKSKYYLFNSLNTSLQKILSHAILRKIS